mgnify:CR=1 FL=1
MVGQEENQVEKEEVKLVTNLEDEVQKFLDYTLPVPCEEIQRVETRKAFIAGLYNGYQILHAMIAAYPGDGEKQNEFHTIYVTQLEEMRKEVLGL